MTQVITVVDTETTGDGPEAQVIELATVQVHVSARGCRLGAISSSMFRPTVPITHEARACHHITDAELAQRGNVITWAHPVLGAQPAAHYAEFDSRLVRQTWPGAPEQPWICTCRVARHLWQNAPRHSNQVLRYWLGLDVDLTIPELNSLPPHRALPDALVTAHLLMAEIAALRLDCAVISRTRGDVVAELLRLTQTPVLLSRCPVGEYKDQPFSAVPLGWLTWVTERPAMDADLLHTARHWLNKADRVPLLLPSLGFGRYRGVPITELEGGYLHWMLKQDFDADIVHTVRTELQRRDVVAGRAQETITNP